MKDAHARLEQLPHYTGAFIVLITQDGINVQIGSTVPDGYRQHLVVALTQWVKSTRPRPSIIVPARDIPRG